MLEQYYVRPVTADRIRTSWIGTAIEQYVGWLAERRYSSRTVLRRIPLLVAFGEFAKTRGATEVAQLVDHAEPFEQVWISRHTKRNCAARARKKGRRGRAQHHPPNAASGDTGLCRPQSCP